MQKGWERCKLTDIHAALERKIGAIVGSRYQAWGGERLLAMSKGEKSNNEDSIRLCALLQ